MSQVLLTNKFWQERCLAEIKPAPFGIEWACGKGALTEGLLGRWEKTVGMELDRRFCKQLKKRFINRQFWLIRTDILDFPLPRLDRTYPLVGNLPYHITGPLLIKILAEARQISSFQGLIQQEVAERITAAPGDSAYSSISVLFRLIGNVEYGFKIPAGAFSPQPEVDSAWINFQVKTQLKDFKKIARFVRLAFHQPRKTLLNNLKALSIERTVWLKFFDDQGWSPTVRPHQLDPQSHMEVYKKWQQEL